MRRIPDITLSHHIHWFRRSEKYRVLELSGCLIATKLLDLLPQPKVSHPRFAHRNSIPHIIHASPLSLSERQLKPNYEWWSKIAFVVWDGSLAPLSNWDSVRQVWLPWFVLFSFADHVPYKRGRSKLVRGVSDPPFRKEPSGVAPGEAQCLQNLLFFCAECHDFSVVKIGSLESVFFARNVTISALWKSERRWLAAQETEHRGAISCCFGKFFV